MIAYQQTSLRTFFYHHQQPTVHHEVYISTENIHQLNGLFDHHPFRYIKHETILCKGGIESGNPIFGGIGQLAIILLHQLRMLFGKVLQATQQDTFRQLGLGQCLAIKSIVHHEIKRSAHVRNIALEYFIRIYRNIQTIQVQSIIGSEQLGHIGIFVLLLLGRGKTQAFKVGKSFGTRCIHHLRAMPAYQGFALTEEVNILLFRFHAYSPISFLIQSNPRFSISNANSGPAVFTIRPL